MRAWLQLTCFGLALVLSSWGCGSDESGRAGTGGSGGSSGAGGTGGVGGVGGMGGVGGSDIPMCTVPADCDDDEPCTLELCVDGDCDYETLADDTGCVATTGLSVCLGGVCQPIWETCSNPSAEEGDFCKPLVNVDRLGRCVSGMCLTELCQIAFDCWDEDPCTSDVCEVDGTCVHPNAPDGTPCGVVAPMQCVEGQCVNVPPT